MRQALIGRYAWQGHCRPGFRLEQELRCLCRCNTCPLVVGSCMHCASLLSGFATLLVPSPALSLPALLLLLAAAVQYSTCCCQSHQYVSVPSNSGLSGVASSSPPFSTCVVAWAQMPSVASFGFCISSSLRFSSDSCCFCCWPLSPAAIGHKHKAADCFQAAQQ